MKIQSLHLYPIKGLSGISVQQAQTAPEGFLHDRRWMLVNKEGYFLSQRSHPILALFKQRLGSSDLQIEYKGNSLSIPFDQLDGDLLQVKVFDDQMEAQEISPAISQWFSDQLGGQVRLVHHCPSTQRQKKLIKGPGQTPVSFADGYPYLIVGTESLAELNRRLESPVPMNRFRPNIVLDTTLPHEEDEWEKVNIGSQKFMVIKPCARCEVTTIDQGSAERGKEPLKTLASYRRAGNKVNFGANAICFGAGIVKVGDEVQVGGS